MLAAEFPAPISAHSLLLVSRVMKWAMFFLENALLKKDIHMVLPQTSLNLGLC